MSWVLAILGAAVGLLIEPLAALLGAMAGFATGRVFELQTELDQTKEYVRRIRRIADRASARVGRISDESERPRQERSEPAELVHSEPAAEESRIEESASFEPVEAPVDVPDRPEIRPADHSTPPALGASQRELDPVRNFIRLVIGENPLVRVASLIIFVGVAVAVKYGVDRGFISIEMRMLLVGALGIVLAGFGWRVRAERREFGLTLQGVGAAILYLAIYGSFYLYELMSPGVAFGAMAVVSGLLIFLAFMQNAQAPALLGLLGGFLSPVLASTGPGDHVVLFSFYGALNFCVVGIAWMKNWRLLGAVGFACTFVVAASWGGLQYRSDLFGSTEPFLILFFLQYVMISIFSLRHRTAGLAPGLDAALVVGLPVVAFTFQARLVEGTEYGLAWSALVLGLFYLLLSALLWHRMRDRAGLFVASFAAIGTVFLTLAVAFALDPEWTGAIWALEGAALVWLGLRQNDARLRWTGLLLQPVAAIMLLSGTFPPDSAPLLFNSYAFGLVCLAVGGFSVAYLYHRFHAPRATPFARMEGILGAGTVWLGLLWWISAGMVEIIRTAESEYTSPLVIALFTVSALAAIGIALRLDWKGIGNTWYVLPVILPLLLLLRASELVVASEPAARLVWLFAFAAVYGMLFLWREQANGSVHSFAHAWTLCLLAAFLALEGYRLLEPFTEEGHGWWIVAPLLGPLLLLLGVLWCSRDGRPQWPVSDATKSYLGLGTPVLVSAVGLWFLSMSNMAAEPSPFLYLPILNPVDLALLVFAGLVLGWLKAVDRTFDSRGWFAIGIWAVAALVFVGLNVTVARTVHAWVGTAYTQADIFGSAIFQTSISIVWTLSAVLAMILAARKSQRVVWITGAVLLAAVVAKLFLVDLSNSSAGTQIISFLGAGFLMLLVAYIAPLPPRLAEE